MTDTIYEITSIQEFRNLLVQNPGLLIIKFGADWCKPCRNIEKQVNIWFKKMPSTIQTVFVNIDISTKLYALLKNKKMLIGIPAILMYKKGNHSYIFDDMVNNSNIVEIDNFFIRCLAIND